MLARKYDMRVDAPRLVLTRRLCPRQPLDGDERRSGPTPATYATAVAKPLSAEQMFHSYLTATGPHGPKTRRPGRCETRFIKAFANPPKEPEIEFARA